MPQKILILGGYGNTGRLIADLLLQHSDARIVIAGRSAERAVRETKKLNAEYSGNRVTVQSVDATDSSELRMACANVDFLVNATSTSDHTREIIQTVLAANVDYLDTQYSSRKVAVLESLRPQIKDSQSCIITDGGFHPGVPAALIRYAGRKFGVLTSASVGSCIRQNWKEIAVSDSTLAEMAEEFRDYRYDVYKGGKWESSWKNIRVFDFGDPIQSQSCAPMFLQELQTLPIEFTSLEEAGFYVAGFHWFVDYIVMMIGWLAMRIWPEQLKKSVGELLLWSLKRTSKPPFLTVLQLEAEGIWNGNPSHFRLRLSHHDGYYLTAAPVVACLLQYLEGEIGSPGLWYQGNIVEPNRFLQDLERLGVTIEETRIQGELE